MEISFPDPQVRDLYNCRASLIHQFGAELAKTICCRLSVLAAAPCLADLPTSPPIGLATTDGKGNFSVSAGPSHRLAFKASTPKAARDLDASRVTEVQVTGLIPVPAPRARKT